MATAELTSLTAQIGETAGEIWQLLDAEGPLKLTQVVKLVDAPRDLAMQAIGWLAREEKIVLEEQNRSRVVSLI
jgi:hypothetical protein